MRWHDSFLMTLLVGVVRLLACTWRYRVHGTHHIERLRAAAARPLVMMLHGRLACVIPYYGRPQRGPNGALVSRSKDGDRIVAVLERFGYHVERGSSHRGGARAIVDVIRAVRARPSVPICFTVDGSRGPRGHLKPGVLLPAQKLGAPMIAVAAAPGRAITLRSWDRMCLPLPFATIRIYASPPMHMPPTAGPDAFEGWRRRFEDLLIRATMCCDRAARHRDREPVRLPLDAGVTA